MNIIRIIILSMSFDYLTLAELQDLCESLEIFPCRGRGITRTVLIKKLMEIKEEPENREMSEEEKLIKQHDPEFYLIILPYINDMPDFRPQYTINKMKNIVNESGELVPEKQKNWAVLAHELDALGHSPEDEEFVSAINNENIDEIRKYTINKENLEKFSFSYPSLLWLLSRIKPIGVMRPLLIGTGLYLENIFPFPKAIPRIADILDDVRDWKTAEYIKKKVFDTMGSYSLREIIQILRNLIVRMDKYRGVGATYIISLLEPKYIPWIIEQAIEYNKLLILNIALSYPHLSCHLKKENYEWYVNKLPTLPSTIIDALISEVRFPEIYHEEITIILLDITPYKDTIDKFINYLSEDRFILPLSIKYGYVNKVKKILSESYIDLFLVYKYLSLLFTKEEHMEDILVELINNKQFDPNANGNKLLKTLILYRKPSLLKILLQYPWVGVIEDWNDIILLLISAPLFITRIFLDSPYIDPSCDENKFLITAIKNKKYDIVHLLLRDYRIDPSSPNNIPLVLACTNNIYSIQNVLFKDSRVNSILVMEDLLSSVDKMTIKTFSNLLAYSKFDPSYDNNRLLRNLQSLQPEHLYVLLHHSKVDPTVNNHEAIILASQMKNSEYLSILLDDKRVDPNARNSEPLIIAVDSDIEKLLLLLEDGRVNPSARNNEALRRAIENNHVSIVTLLLSSPSVTISSEIIELAKKKDPIIYKELMHHLKFL